MAGSIYRCLVHWENEASFWYCLWLPFAIVCQQPRAVGPILVSKTIQRLSADVGSRRLQIYAVADVLTILVLPDLCPIYSDLAERFIAPLSN
jgi:hypothetical protein